MLIRKLLRLLMVFSLLVCLFPLPGALAQQQTQIEQLIPFFDTDPKTVRVHIPSQPIDISPPPPPLTTLDQAILQLCGPIGGPVTPTRFQTFLTKYPSVSQQIQQAVGGELIKGRRSVSQFEADLTAIWFERQAFKHIFCGELKPSGEVAGLHYAGRYLQLQQQGIAGRLPDNRQNEEILPDRVYTLGVLIQKGDRQYIGKRKGYLYPGNAIELLISATRMFKLEGRETGSCFYQLRATEVARTYPLILVKDQSALVTVYPDVTPQVRRCGQFNKSR